MRIHGFLLATDGPNAAWAGAPIKIEQDASVFELPSGWEVLNRDGHKDL